MDKEVLTLRQKALREAGTWCLAKPGTWEDILRFVQMQHLMTKADTSQISDCQAEAMTEMC